MTDQKEYDRRSLVITQNAILSRHLRFGVAPRPELREDILKQAAATLSDVDLLSLRNVGTKRLALFRATYGHG